MARAGQTIENPVSGERFTFLQTAADTNGELLQFELVLRPGGRIPIAHRHAAQEERFAIVSGTVRARVRGGWRDLTAGESIVIAPGTPHVLRNESQAEARIIGELRPAMHTEEVFEAMCALAQEGKVSKSGLPNPLRMAVLAHGLGQQDYAPGIPIVVQKAAFVVLSAIGRWLLGYRASQP
jgi:mannose-6-phosphate isomerase-like protein (cupin superfamily)